MSCTLPVETGAAGPHAAESAAGLLVLAPLAIDARAVRAGVPGARVIRAGVGPRRARGAAALARTLPASAVAIAGSCAAIAPDLEPGELVLASELRGPDGTIPCPAAGILAGMLRRAGIPVRLGPIISHPHGVLRSERERLGESGAIAIDTESAWLAAAAAGRPLAVLRSVVRTHSGRRSIGRPLATVASGARANRALGRATWVLSRWAAAIAPRELVLASPRASCAGVDRAIEVVERALAQHGAPVYVRRQIVHNAHVVGDLERRGAIFVEEVDEAPEGATVVFSAHGVSPAVRSAAGDRELAVIDATCPLVAKVHGEARRFAAGGYAIVLVGHAGHDEIEGTLGEAPGSIQLVDSVAAVAALEVPDPERVAYLTQTTLAVDETREIVAALRRRFPRLAGPRSDDICYATQNRQDAVRAIAAQCDLLLVVGSQNSSNSRRLVEVARRAGRRSYLIDDESGIDPAWLVGVHTVGIAAGASAPELVVRRVIAALAGFGPVTTSERAVTRESVRFKLPPDIQRG